MVTVSVDEKRWACCGLAEMSVLGLAPLVPAQQVSI